MTTDLPRTRLGRLGAIAVCTAIAGLGLTLAGSHPAHAAPSAQTTQLCAQDTIECSIRSYGVTREGVQLSAQVTGRPDAQVSLRLYRVVLAGNRIQSLQPLGNPVPVELNHYGIGGAAIPVPATDGNAGWTLLSVADLPTSALDPSQTVGSFLATGGRRPIVLGDGFAEQKPVGTTLDLQLGNAVDTHRFAVEFYDDQGIWRDATVPAPRGGSTEDTISHIGYEVPRGLRARPYQFRLRNLSDRSEPQTWRVIPSTNGQPQARQAMWRPPVLGQHVEGATVLDRHDPKVVSGALWSLAAVAVLGAAAVAGLRRTPVVGVGR